jgi:hypothetical protein
VRYLEDNKIITPGQAGFRARCSWVDQVICLIQRRESTFAVFLDFKQVYDRVLRPGLFLKLKRLGITSNMYR